jgi:hypothetical protein
MFSRRSLALAVVVAFAALLAVAFFTAPRLVATAIRTGAARRGLVAAFDPPRLILAPGIRLTRLILRHAVSGDTLIAAESLEVRLSLGHLLTLRIEPNALQLAHARIRLAARRSADPDTLSPEESAPTRGRHRRPGRSDRPGRVRSMANQLVRALLVPAFQLPRLDLRDVHVTRINGAGDTLQASLDRLTLTHESRAVELRATGTFATDRPVPFEGELRYGRDDRLTGHWNFGVPDPRARTVWPLDIAVDARLHQDRRAGRVELREPSIVRIGTIALHLTATVRRDGPAARLALSADSLDDTRLRASLPPPVLGPLADVGTRGSWDYRLHIDLDVARPDSVDFEADVIPHGLTLDPERTRLNLLTLDQPFTAIIHLPHDRLVPRDLSEANPHFRSYDEIDSVLVHAVVTNEDGGFFRHRGFNSEAVKGAIADNIRAGAFKRGAGTITMQIARNLWLGHARTLSRKGQEVALAWILEHLTGTPKRRLLEIYLNIIEWGPDVHGADEAARYYFDRDARNLKVDEALFLTTVIPAPTKWKYRFDADGELRDFERAQMHFIGRAMVARGWLSPGDLPAPEDLRVQLRGPARDVLFPPAGVAGDLPARTQR